MLHGGVEVWKKKLTSVPELEKGTALGVTVDSRNQVRIRANDSSRGFPASDRGSKAWV